MDHTAFMFELQRQLACANKQQAGKALATAMATVASEIDRLLSRAAPKTRESALAEMDELREVLLCLGTIGTTSASIAEIQLGELAMHRAAVARTKDVAGADAN